MAVSSLYRGLIEAQKKRMGLNTQVGDRDHPFPVKKVPVIQDRCPVCGTRNNNKRLRCRKCDTIIVRKRGGGEAKDQLDYVNEFLDKDNQRELAKQDPRFRRSDLRVNNRVIDP